jgi:hypothetical protein
MYVVPVTNAPSEVMRLPSSFENENALLPWRWIQAGPD